MQLLNPHIGQLVEHFDFRVHGELKIPKRLIFFHSCSLSELGKKILFKNIGLKFGYYPSERNYPLSLSPLPPSDPTPNFHSTQRSAPI